MTITKLCLDLQVEALSDMFYASKATFSSIFWKWIEVIATKLSIMIAWADHEASINALPLALLTAQKYSSIGPKAQKLMHKSILPTKSTLLQKF